MSDAIVRCDVCGTYMHIGRVDAHNTANHPEIAGERERLTDDTPHEVLAALEALREMRVLRDTMLAQAKRLSHLVDVVTDVEPILKRVRDEHGPTAQ